MAYRAHGAVGARGRACAIALLVTFSLLAGEHDAAYAHQGRSHAEAEAAPPAPAPATAPPLEEPIHETAPSHEHSAKAEPHAAAAAATHPYPPEGVPRPLAWLGKLHPAVVHFPIALLTAAALSELLLVRTGRESFLHATRFCVQLGSLGALGAAVLGWLFAGFRLVDEEWVMTTHRWLGTSTSAWALLLLLLCERAQRTSERRALRRVLFPGAALVAATGFFGGALIYGIDHYAW